MRDSAMPHNAGVCDLRSALVRLDGDADLLRMLIAVFHEDAPELLTRLSNGAQSGDWRAVERAAHSLKGLAANFDGAPARDAAAALEQMARNGAGAGIEAAIQDLTAEVRRLQAALSASQI